jgi:hypothetical protein
VSQADRIIDDAFISFRGAVSSEGECGTWPVRFGGYVALAGRPLSFPPERRGPGDKPPRPCVVEPEYGILVSVRHRGAGNGTRYATEGAYGTAHAGEVKD